MPDTFGYPQQTPQSPSTGLFHDRERPIRRPLAHRLDEFPAGYSSADCSPAGSASASPTVDHFALMSSRRSILFCRTVNSVLTVCLSSGDQPRNLTLLVAVATLLLTVYLYIIIPKGFFPVQDTGQIQGVSESDQSISFGEMSRSPAAPRFRHS